MTSTSIIDNTLQKEKKQTKPIYKVNNSPNFLYILLLNKRLNKTTLQSDNPLSTQHYQEWQQYWSLASLSVALMCTVWGFWRSACAQCVFSAPTSHTERLCRCVVLWCRCAFSLDKTSLAPLLLHYGWLGCETSRPKTFPAWLSQAFSNISSPIVESSLMLQVRNKHLPSSPCCQRLGMYKVERSYRGSFWHSFTSTLLTVYRYNGIYNSEQYLFLQWGELSEFSFI